MLEESTKKIIIANLLKYTCNNALLSQKNIVDKTGKSKQYVSTIFNGTGAINHQFIDQVLNTACHHKFNHNDYFQNKISDFLNDFLTEYSYKVNYDLPEYLNDCLNENAFYSYACPEYLALKCAVHYRKKEFSELKKWISIIETDFIDSLKLRHEAYVLFLMIKAEYQMDLDQWSNSLTSLTEAKNYSGSLDFIQGVIYLYEGMVYYQLYKNLDALLSFQKAEEELKKHNNHHRALAAAKNIASCLSRMQNFYQAEIQFLNVIRMAERMKRYDIIDFCNNDLAFINLKKGEFKKAIQFAEKINNNFEFRGYYSHLAWSYYYLNDIDNCKKYQELMDNNCHEDYFVLMSKLLTAYLDKKDSLEKLSILQDLFDISLNDECFGDAIWIAQMMIIEYKAVNDLEKAVYYHKILLDLLGYNSYWYSIL